MSDQGSSNDPSEKPSSEQRRRELIEAARQQVEHAAWDGSVSPSDSPTRIEGDASPPDGPGAGSSLPPPDSFAGYKILREIHRGAQGVVYQAVQKSMKRKVAIKVMKEGPFAGADDRARFDREVRLLGQLNHPNIVTIHGTGEASGCQYFVMDYISGQPLDVYMASEDCSIDETLRLFAKISSAVETAHLRGIVHRDLKPSNIRVDSKGEPYVLDFGLAKSASDTDTSLATMTGRFLGTPAWASPEQAEGVPSNIDIRSDVYSLGVILYQMLTGKFPYKVTGSTQDVLDRIKHAEPLRPKGLRRNINDEVEAIVFKCLSKDRERRYQSAGQLARDLDRYLAGEPIEAKRDSLAYVFKKHLRRFRPQATAAASLSIVIMVTLITVFVLWNKAEAAVESEHNQRMRAEQYAAELESAKHEIDRKHRALMENQDLAYKLFDDMKEFLERDWSTEQTVIEAAMRHMFGRNLRRVDRLDEAEASLDLALGLRRELLGEEHEDTLDSANELARVYLNRGERGYVEAGRLLSETLAICRRVLKPASRTTLDCMHNLALLRGRQEQYEEARQLFEEVVEIRKESIGEEHEHTLTSMSSLAGLYARMGELDDAAKLHEIVLETRRRVLKPNHRYTLNSMSNLGGVYTLLGRYDQAEQLLEEAVAGARLTLPEGHGNTGAYLKYYGRVLLRKGSLEEAEAALLESHSILFAAYGEEDDQVVNVLELLVELYEESEKPDKVSEYKAMIVPPSK